MQAPPWKMGIGNQGLDSGWAEPPGAACGAWVSATSRLLGHCSPHPTALLLGSGERPEEVQIGPRSTPPALKRKIRICAVGEAVCGGMGVFAAFCLVFLLPVAFPPPCH